MLMPATMKKVAITVLRADVRKVTRALGELGVVQLTSATRESRELKPADVEEREENCEKELSRAQSLMEDLDIDPPDGLPDAGAFKMPLKKARRILDEAEEGVAPLLEEMQELERSLNHYGDARERLYPLRRLDVPFSQLREHRFFHLIFGSVPAEELAQIREALPRAALPIRLEPEHGGREEGERESILVMSSRRDRFAVQTVLEDSSFEKLEIPADYTGIASTLYEQVSHEYRAAEKERREVAAQIQEVAADVEDRLRAAYQRLLVEARLHEAEHSFGATWATMVITGWAPANQVENVRDTVQQVTGGRAIVEVREASRREIEQSEVPSYTVQWSFLQPFARLVAGYGSASYDEVEPTVMFAASALLMFGLMFGDLGHGLCAFAAGMGLYRRASSKSMMKDLGYVICAAGLTSALFGTFLQGTVFGWPLTRLGFQWTLDFEPVRLHGGGAGAGRHVLRYMGLALALGIVLISLGVVLNMINRLRKGDVTGAILNRFGLVGGAFYWIVVSLVMAGMFLDVSRVTLQVGGVIACLPLLTLFFGQPLRDLFIDREEEHEEESGSPWIDGFLEMWEALLTYVTNTLSFLRVAAFALIHAALSYSVYVLMELVGQLPAGLVWKSLVFVIGTVLIIGLEGLVVGIQIFRLEYYEFFTKFFRASGRKFNPFRLTGTAPSS